jgi:hypothetical protein
MSDQPDEVASEVTRRGGEALRAGMMAASELAMTMAARRAEAHRAAAADSDQQRAGTERRLRAENAAAQPVMRLAWNEKWWREATPEQISDVWKVTAGWAGNGDPYATATLDRMREELQRRHGIAMPATAAHADISEALARDGTGRDADAARARDAADTLRSRSRDEDGTALADDDTAAREPVASHAAADADAADDLRVAAADDRDSAAGQEAAAAAATAARGLPMTPGARLAAGRSSPAQNRAPRRARTPEHEHAR